jgi:hypothetical protein
MMLRVALETQTWVAAIKELLISKGVTTDEEFGRYVASSILQQCDPSDEPALDLPSEVREVVN